MKRWLVLLGCLASVGCSDSCGSNQQLAELTRLSGGHAERDHAARVGSWRAAMLHDRFYLGDGLRTGKDSRADLDLLPSGTVRVESRTLLRFLPRAPQARSTRVSLERGALELSAAKMDLEVHTPRAVARVAPGGKLKLSAIDGLERFDLIVGRVQVAYAGTLRTLELKEPLELRGTPAEQRPESSDAAPAGAAPPLEPKPEL